MSSAMYYICYKLIHECSAVRTNNSHRSDQAKNKMGTFFKVDYQCITAVSSHYLAYVVYEGNIRTSDWIYFPAHQ